MDSLLTRLSELVETAKNLSSSKELSSPLEIPSPKKSPLEIPSPKGIHLKESSPKESLSKVSLPKVSSPKKSYKEYSLTETSFKEEEMNKPSPKYQIDYITPYQFVNVPVKIRTQIEVIAEMLLKGRNFIETLLLPFKNANLFPITIKNKESIETSGTILGPIIGEGSLAIVRDVIQPQSSLNLQSIFNLPMVAKYNKDQLVIWDDKAPAEKVGRSYYFRHLKSSPDGHEDIQAIIKQFPSIVNGKRNVNIEFVVEVFISALASYLFSEGITPHTILSFHAFSGYLPSSEDDYVDHSKIFLLQEKLGNGKDKNNVDHLPLVLNDIAISLPHLPPIDLVEACDEIFLSVLHTLHILQSQFRLNTLDMKTSNVMIKYLIPLSSSSSIGGSDDFIQSSSYFRQKDLQTITHFIYSYKGKMGKRQFYLPQRGFMAKIGDMGMAVVHGPQPIVFYPFDPENYWNLHKAYKYALIKKYHLENEEIIQDYIQDELSYNFDDDEQLFEALKNYSMYSNNEKKWGIKSQFDPCYDLSMFALSIKLALNKWIKGERKQSICEWLIDECHFTYSENERPSSIEALITQSVNPIEALDFIFNTHPHYLNTPHACKGMHIEIPTVK